MDECNGNNYLTLVHIDKSKDTLKSVKNFGRKKVIRSILLDQQVIDQTILIKNVWKSDSVQMVIYPWKKQ